MFTRQFAQLINVFTALAFGVTTLVACVSNNDENVPLIFAAASLSDVLEDSAELYENETEKRIEFSFGGSLTLANQITQLGAPADGVFLVGDTAISRISAADMLTGDGNGAVLFNQIALIGTNNSLPLESLTDLGDREGRIAIGNPELAPAGHYAKQAMMSAGVWDQLSDRLVLTSDVRSAMAAVTSGNVEFAFVYTSDVASSQNNSFKQLTVIEDGYDQIFYTFAPIYGAANHEAVTDFKSFLSSSKQAQDIFNAAGFQWNVLLTRTTDTGGHH